MFVAFLMARLGYAAPSRSCAAGFSRARTACPTARARGLTPRRQLAADAHSIRDRDIAAQRGRAVFADPERNQLHPLPSRGWRRGSLIGPTSRDIGGKFARPHLIESVLEPSRQIVEGYRSTLRGHLGRPVGHGPGQG